MVWFNLLRTHATLDGKNRACGEEMAMEEVLSSICTNENCSFQFDLVF